MMRANRGATDYREVLDPRRRRRALLFRAALASGVMLLLVIGLSLYDGEAPGGPQVSGVVSTQPVRPVASPQPIADEPVAQDAAPTTILHDAPGSSGERSGEAGSADIARGGSADDEAESPAVADSESPAAAGKAEGGDAGDGVRDRLSQDLVSPAEVQVNGLSVAPRTREAPTVAAPRPPAPRPTMPAARQFQVQVGAYVEPDAAIALQADLAVRGFPAQTQSRVAVGPYPGRAEAGRALARLGAEQGLRGLLIESPGGGGFAVQLGVFGEPGNAERLARRLESAGFAVQMHRRVVLGPFPDRRAAESAVAELGVAQGGESVIVALPSR